MSAIKNVRFYVCSTITSNFGKRCLDRYVGDKGDVFVAGNPFAVAFDKALDKRVKVVKKSRKG